MSIADHRERFALPSHLPPALYIQKFQDQKADPLKNQNNPDNELLERDELTGRK